MKNNVSALLLAALLCLSMAGCKQPDNPIDDEPQVDQNALSEWATTVNSDLASLRMTIASADADAYVKSISSDAKGWTLGLSFNSELFVMDPTLSEALPSGRISETTLKERLANCLPSDSAYASEQGICKDFISWIESKGGFATDQAGNQRNASAMWPGAYERQ
jgi:hypothetical protein